MRILRLATVLGGLAFFSLCASIAYSDVRMYIYTPPTTYIEDNSPIQPGDLVEARLYANGVIVAQEFVIDGDIQTDLPPGVHQMTLTTVTAKGVESPHSNIVLSTVDGAAGETPAAVTDLTATVDFTDCTAHDNGFVCVVQRNASGTNWTEYTLIYGGAQYFGYWPSGYCPSFPVPVSLTPAC